MRVDQRVFQFARSVPRPAGHEDVDGRLTNCGRASPDNRFVDPVVGELRRPLPRLCSAVGSELISWDSCVPMFKPLKLLACETAAACVGAVAVLVVCGGSVNGVSCDAVADEAA